MGVLVNGEWRDEQAYQPVDEVGTGRKRPGLIL